MFTFLIAGTAQHDADEVFQLVRDRWPHALVGRAPAHRLFIVVTLVGWRHADTVFIEALPIEREYARMTLEPV